MSSMEQRKILIVDDSELNRAILAELFRSDYDVLEAENGNQAIELIERNFDDIAIMLLDIIMPVLNGFEVMEIMNRRFWIGHIPVVMITTDTSEEAMEKGYKLGASDVITKPFNPRIVRQRIMNIDELYRHKRNLERLAGQQLDSLRSKAENVRRTNEDMVKMLARLVEIKAGKSAPKADEVREITTYILNEYSRENPNDGVTDEYITGVSAAAAVYDIGKIFVPEDILNKPDVLTTDEYNQVKNHSAKGAEFIGQISETCSSPLLNICKEICRSHHERADGNGYPDGLNSENTPLSVQTVAIASAYDALINPRPYRRAYTHDEAVEMIKNGECGRFGDKILNAFIRASVNFRSSSELSQHDSADMSADGNDWRNHDSSVRVLQLLEKERARYLILSDMSGDIIVDYECDINTISFSDGFTMLTGLKSKYCGADKFISETNALFDEDRQHIRDIVSSLSEDNPSAKSEVRIKLKNNTYKWFEMYLHSVWSDEYCTSIMGKLVNIDRQKRETEQWRKAADTDPLTGILNKLAVENFIVEAINADESALSALCFVDLDNFKRINDTYGHQFGDMVLKKVAEQLKKAVRGSDIVGRVGGDEFVVFLRGIGSRKNISVKAEQLCRIFKMSCGECKISGSIGIACCPDDGTSYEALLGKADRALYNCKGRGKDSFIFYDDEYSEQPYKSLLSATESNSEG